MNISEHVDFNKNCIIFTDLHGFEVADTLLRAFIANTKSTVIDMLLDDQSATVVNPDAYKECPWLSLDVANPKESKTIIFNDSLSKNFITSLCKLIYYKYLGKKIILIENKNKQESHWAQLAIFRYTYEDNKHFKQLFKFMNIFIKSKIYNAKIKIISLVIKESVNLEKIAFGFGKGDLYCLKKNSLETVSFFYHSSGKEKFSKFLSKL